MSLSTGIIGNSKINCHQALEVGNQIMKSIIGSKFGDIKQSRKNVVLSLGSMSNAVKSNNETLIVDPLMIFQRTLILKKNAEDVADLLRYELSPFPLALFNEGVMRKSKKSSLYDAFPVDSTIINPRMTTNVIDGGFLLHRVKWNVGCKFSSICDLYIAHIFKHYGKNCTVIFYGYDDVDSTKRQEQKRRRSTKTSVDINFHDNMNVTIQQEHFLSNEKNKTRLIQLLTEKMVMRGIEARIANGDADSVIVRCASEKAVSHQTVIIIGEDVDLVVLLIALASAENDIYFLKPGKGNVEAKLFSTRKLKELPFSEVILFLHAFSGCDTTSAIYKKSKAIMVNLFKKQSRLIRDIASIFYSSSSTQNEISQAGEKMFLTIYNANANEKDLNNYRYLFFLKSSTKIKADLSSFPPTKGAAEQHSFRVYLQIQQWLDNNLHPEQWGWTRIEDGSLFPITTNDPVAPEKILNSIFCRCTTGCSGRCGCRKAGIQCSSACSSCNGGCTNGVLLDDEFDIDDIMSGDAES